MQLQLYWVLSMWWISLSRLDEEIFALTPSIYINSLLKEYYFSIGISWLTFDINAGIRWK